MLCQRYVSGGVQAGINLEDVREIQVPLPDHDVQRAIGNKVRKAERLRAHATASRKEADLLLGTVLNMPSLPNVDSRTNFVEGNNVKHRLDAKFYKHDFIAARKAAEEAARGRCIGDVVDSVSNGAELRRYVSDGRPYLCVGSVNHGMIDVGANPKIAMDVPVPQRALGAPGDVLVVRSGNTVAQAVDLLADECAPAPAISSHFIVLRLQDTAISGYLAAYLNSELGVTLQLQIAYGAVQPQIGQDDLLEIPLPQLGEDVEARIASLNSHWRRFTAESRTQVLAAEEAIERLVRGESLERALVEDEEIARWLEANPMPNTNEN